MKGKSVESQKPNTPTYAGFTTQSQFKLIDPDSFSDDEFRLTRYGLPEPAPTESRQMRWWLVMLCSGLALLALWRYLTRHERNTTR